jgi:hypothetical protein
MHLTLSVLLARSTSLIWSPKVSDLTQNNGASYDRANSFITSYECLLVRWCAARNKCLGQFWRIHRPARLVEQAPLRTFTTPRAALQAGLEGFRSGDTASAIEELKYGASGGETLAQWKLAKIYTNGDGVPRDDLKAYDYFSQIATNYDEDNPDQLCRSIKSRFQWQRRFRGGQHCEHLPASTRAGQNNGMELSWARL